MKNRMFSVMKSEPVTKDGFLKLCENLNVNVICWVNCICCGARFPRINPLAVRASHGAEDAEWLNHPMCRKCMGLYVEENPQHRESLKEGLRIRHFWDIESGCAAG